MEWKDFNSERRHSQIQVALDRAMSAHRLAHETEITAATAHLYAEVAEAEAQRADEEAKTVKKERIYMEKTAEPDEVVLTEFASLKEKIQQEARKVGLTFARRIISCVGSCVLLNAMRDTELFMAAGKTQGSLQGI